MDTLLLNLLGGFVAIFGGMVGFYVSLFVVGYMSDRHDVMRERILWRKAAVEVSDARRKFHAGDPDAFAALEQAFTQHADNIPDLMTMPTPTSQPHTSRS